MIARVIYLLCALTSLGCALLLLRAFAARRARLLLWSGLCFVCFFVNNVLLYLDLEVFTATDLSLIRTIPIVVGLALLLYGLIWEVR
jgi:Family of unknown function (DUF5985)